MSMFDELKALGANVDEGDHNTVIEKTHAIKGVTGNLSITPLFEAYSDIVSLERKGSFEEARAVFDNIQPVQEKIMECIKKNRG